MLWAGPVFDFTVGAALTACRPAMTDRRHDDASYRFSSPAASLPAADLVFWKVSHGCRGPFVSRTASFPTTSGSPQCSDLAYLGQYAWGATGNENMQRGMRRYRRSKLLCTFLNSVSCCDAPTCRDTSGLTRCHLRSVSNSCHFLRARPTVRARR